ncbi:MAG: hypothetical protein ACREV9_10150 [Burkholderiales bacterium]
MSKSGQENAARGIIFNRADSIAPTIEARSQVVFCQTNERQMSHSDSQIEARSINQAIASKAISAFLSIAAPLFSVSSLINRGWQ